MAAVRRQGGLRRPCIGRECMLSGVIGQIAAPAGRSWVWSLLLLPGSCGIHVADDWTDLPLRKSGITPFVEDNMTQARPGQPAPVFTLATIDGQSITVSHSRGRPHLLVFLRHLG